jgi:hypothetical protein
MLHGGKILKNEEFKKVILFFQNPADPKVQFDASTYKGAVPLRLSHQGLLVESPISNFEDITCLKHCIQEGFSRGNFD